jgi:phosphodiesterase/alkaline phosphatase D-like protein
MEAFMRRGEWRPTLLAAAPLFVLALLIGSCKDDKNPIVPSDTTAPATTASLTAGTVTTTSVQLTWTAPGDDGTTGTASRYDIRYSTSTITVANFALATAVTGAPIPEIAGTSQSVTVSGLTPSTAYHFAMKTADEVPNWSGLSNDVPATTAPAADVVPPAAVANLATGTVTTTSVQLTWTAPGDDGTTGTAGRYDIRYSTSEITAANFASATAVTGAPTPAVAGTSQSVTVSGLAPNTPYYFALKSADEVPNWSGLSNVVPATTVEAADVTPPAAVANLAAGPVTASSVHLTWAAPGDDGSTGTASRYDIRVSTSVITEANFGSATSLIGAPTPATAGTSQSVTVNGLTPNTPYYFAMVTADEVPNWSGLSNVAPATTVPAADATPPSAITDLEATPADSTDVLLNWTAPGDDEDLGTAQEYDVRYSMANITRANWAAATPVSGEPTPTAAGTTQNMHVTGLHPGTDYFFAMKTSDEVPNTSALSNVATVHTPTGPTNPPMISTLDLPDSVCISSNDQYAQIAKFYVMGQLAIARGYASLGSAFLTQLENADWQQAGECWNYTYDILNCSVSYDVCKTGSDFEYSVTYDGPCTGQSYSDWVAYRATFSYSTHIGTFYQYAPGSTAILNAWVWTEAADGLSGSYTFYEGDPASPTPTVQGSIEWSKSVDGNTTSMTFINPGQSKWVSSFTKIPCAGWLKMYQWDDDGSQWQTWPQTDIAWNPDGGFYNTYDDTGQLQDTHTW